MENGGTKKQLEQLVVDAATFERSQTRRPRQSQAQARRYPSAIGEPRLCGSMGRSLLNHSFSTILVLPNGIPFVASLVIFGTHVFEIFDCFPYLTITSPTKRCGKTRFAEILELLCAVCE